MRSRLTRWKLGEVETDRGPWVAALVAADYHVYTLERATESMPPVPHAGS